MEEPPAKLLDDLFRKTKSTPCIYWLPLTTEQVSFDYFDIINVLGILCIVASSYSLAFVSGSKLWAIKHQL